MTKKCNTGKFVYEKESGPVYIDRHLSKILNNALEGELFLSVLKGFLWGQCLRAKGVKNCFGGSKE